jgi:sensor histidine kinase YesM
VYGILIYLLILLINNNVAQLNQFFSSGEVYISIALTYLSFETIRLTIVLLDKFLSPQYRLTRIPIQLATSTVLSTVVVIAGLSAYFIYVIGFSIATSQLIIFTVIYIFSALLYNLLYFSNDYLHRENTLKLNAERQQREVLEMEMTEFKNDINPDLLYESLENVISLMNKKNDQAEEYIDYLASAYRYVLTNRQRELISLRAEIDAAKNIVRLLNERYFGQVKIEISLTESDLNRHLIPGSLPVVIEYIVRNTIISNQQPLTIKCYVEDDEYLIVQSPLNDRLLLHTESLLALARLQKSYSLYSELPMIQVKAYEENYIKLPALRVTEDILIQHS